MVIREKKDLNSNQLQGGNKVLVARLGSYLSARQIQRGIWLNDNKLLTRGTACFRFLKG